MLNNKKITIYAKTIPNSIAPIHKKEKNLSEITSGRSFTNLGQSFMLALMRMKLFF